MECLIQCFESPKLRTVTKGVTKIEGLNPFVPQMGDQQVLIGFGIVRSLALNVLLFATYMENCTPGIFSKARKIVLQHSAAVTILRRGTAASVTMLWFRETHIDEQNKHATD